MLVCKYWTFALSSSTEEILHSNVAHWWSPNAVRICYATFNDTLVPMYKFPYYGGFKNYYGDIEEIAYPKVFNAECVGFFIKHHG